MTAGNSSQHNDAAAACLVVAEEHLDALGLEPIGYLEGWAAVGCEPSRMGIGPVRAVEKLFARAGVGLDDLALIEVNKAFAVHPIGATGVRILTTMLHELQRGGGGLALETMCIGGGQGLAALLRGAG